MGRWVWILALTVAPATARPQDVSEAHRRGGWIALHTGRTLTGPERVLSKLHGEQGRTSLDLFAAEVALRRGSNALGVRGSLMLDEDIGSGSSVSELGALYYRVVGGRRYQATIGAGVGKIDACAATRVEEGVGYERCQGSVFGVPISAGLAFRPVPQLALGTQLMGNANGRSFVSAWSVFLRLVWGQPRLSAGSSPSA